MLDLLIAEPWNSGDLIDKVGVSFWLACFAILAIILLITIVVEIKRYLWDDMLSRMTILGGEDRRFLKMMETAVSHRPYVASILGTDVAISAKEIDSQEWRHAVAASGIRRFSWRMRMIMRYGYVGALRSKSVQERCEIRGYVTDSGGVIKFTAAGLDFVAPFHHVRALIRNPLVQGALIAMMTVAITLFFTGRQTIDVTVTETDAGGSEIHIEAR